MSNRTSSIVMGPVMSEQKNENVQDVAGGMPGRLLPAKYDGRTVLTVEEVAGILMLSRGSAYVAARKGEIPTVRIGHRLLVPRVGLERLLAG
jgi:excisionase family DNA binding protein